MITLMADLKAKEGKADEAKALLRKLAEEVKAKEPGTLIYTMHQRRDDPLCFVVYERYKDDGAMQVHMANLAQHGASLASLFEGTPNITFLEEL